MTTTPGTDGPDHDTAWMRRSLDLARNGLGLASPNPMVGAVVVAGGEVVGEGWHQGPGTPHAEAMALAQAGDRARGATLYVTLEPCAHQGRTPPCAPAIRDAGIARVAAAIRDPNPVVDGRGFAMLGGAGIPVSTGVEAEAASELVEGFARHVRTGLPFVTLKMAMSLDGKTAARDGTSRWITGEPARRDVHHLRAASDAVLVGVGTAVADDPSLTVRLDGYRGRQPLRVVMDGRGRLPARGALFDGRGPTLVATTHASSAQVRRAWEAAGVQVAVVDEDDTPGRMAFGPLLEALGKRDVQTLLIEGGPTVAWEAVRAGAVHRLVLYVAPMLIGGRDAPGMLHGEGVSSIGDALPWRIVGTERLGQDLKIVAAPEGGRGVHGDR